MNGLWRNLTLVILTCSLSASASLEWTEQAVTPEMEFSTAPVTCKVFQVEGVLDTGLIDLPFPDGSVHRFQIAPSALMHPDLAARFPDIQTWEGAGLEHPEYTLRLDASANGYHIQILTPDDTIYMDPCLPGDPAVHVVHRRRDARAENGWTCATPAPVMLRAQLQQLRNTFSNGDLKRTYRLAVAATGEYTGFHGGTVNDGMAAIVTTINRVSGIYARELSINFQLVANNHLLVYTNGFSDPYSNANGSLLVAENQTNMDLVIGDANYDIGHVFGTAGGGRADAGLCVSSLKARGQTGAANPVGDRFYVDFVAHEVGHQLGANHTFNGVVSDCAGNRWAPNAFAPGSGSTIMSYASLCGTDNLQTFSDDYFHTANLEEIMGYLAMISDCAVTNASGNQLPQVDAGSDKVIPAHTPFTLTATGSDPDGQTVRFTWEQMNLGPAAALDAPDDGLIPLFRSWTPGVDPSRTFPRLANLLINTTPKGEQLPSTSRVLNFRVTARDHAPGGGAVSADDMTVSVDAAAGPFEVTAPAAAVTWSNLQSVTWNVANTDGGLVQEATVDILLSLDGGLSFPVSLAAGTPNDGTQLVQMPSIDAGSARIKVAAANGIFFDINDGNFTLRAFESLAVQPSAPQVLVGPTGGPVHPPCTTYAVSNITSSSVSWQAGLNQDFLSVDVSSGVLPAGQSINLQVCTNNATTLLPTGIHTALLLVTNLNSGGVVQRSLSIDARPPGGILSMVASVIHLAEADGSALIGVNRSGLSNRAVQVTCTTVPNTAVAGDYLAVTGTLSWAAGELGVKNFSVDITNDADVEGRENFRVMLSNPGNGAEIGLPNFTTVTITDDDSPGNNDLCADAVMIGSMPFSTTQSTVGFTSAGEPTPLCTPGPIRGAWYRYTPPTVGRLRVDTQGSDFNTVLALYQGSCGALNEWFCNDNVGFQSHSTVGSFVYPGQTYYILAGGFDEAAGNLSIQMTFAPETNTCANILQDSGFEEGIPYPLWPVNSSVNFGTILCDSSCGAPGSLAGPRTGASFGWFTGPDVNTETANLGQPVYIPSGAASLSFHLWVGKVTAPFNDIFSVLIDGLPVLVIPEPSTAFVGYRSFNVDVSTFADGLTHGLVFRLVGDGGGNSEWSLDDLALTVCIPDLDADGLPNEWEHLYGLNATNAADAALDSDLDRLTNIEEFIAGTDPSDPDDFLRLMIEVVSPSVVELSFNSTTSRLYALDYRDALLTGSWINLDTNLPGSGNPIMRQDTNSLDHRLYRVRVELEP